MENPKTIAEFLDLLGTTVRALQARLDQAHWDAISRDQTIENLRNENEEYRQTLEFYACDDTYLPVMELDGTPITGTVVVLHDGGHVARVALGYEEEKWFNPRDAAYPDRFIAHAQSDIPALLDTIAEMRTENERLRDAVVQLRDSIAGCREDMWDQPHLLKLWDLAADVLGEGQCREEG